MCTEVDFICKECKAIQTTIEVCKRFRKKWEKGFQSQRGCKRFDKMPETLVASRVL